MEFKDWLRTKLEDRGINATQFADAIKEHQPTIQRILSGETKNPRFLLVKKIEEYFDNKYVKDRSVPVTDSNIASNLNYIKKYDEKGGSMGTGLILKDQPGQITNLVVTDEWINKNVPSHTGKKNLSVVTGFGDSMKGMFNPGDPLLVDTGINNCDHDGVFFFRIGDEGYVKRLQRIPNVGIKVISKNPDYETWTITDDMDFEVFAKVLIVWKSENF